MWHIGNGNRYTSRAGTERPSTVPRTAAVSERLVCTAPFGTPVEPLVNTSQAGSSSAGRFPENGE